MPKKRTFNFKQLQGSSSASGTQGNSDGADRKTQTVNERLGELRKLPGKDAAQKKRELADAVASNQRSVPPSLLGVLGISQSAPPKPKRGVRTRLPNRTPGPAPPQSWLKPTLVLRGGGKAVKRSRGADRERSRAKQLFRFDRLSGLHVGPPDTKPSSLLHLTLKTAAEQWDLFDEEDLPALSELPLRLRLRLLSYLAFYGPPIDMSVLEALTLSSEPVTHLDLAGIVGYGSFTLQRFTKYARHQMNMIALPEPDKVAESWDLEDTLEAALVLQPSMSRLSQLTHLSLSHPGPGSSWRDLLWLSKHIQSVTHLSLAYWPRPTLTPNLATATVSSQHSPDVTAGGSHYYSAIDDDLNEPASLLRQLSANLLRLQWLDLEGCAEWIPALACHGETAPKQTRPIRDAGGEVGWSESSGITSIFANNWKNIQWMNFSQGWVPNLAVLRDHFGRQSIVERYLSNFAKSEIDDEVLESGPVYEMEIRKACLWLELEEKILTTARSILLIRKNNSCRPITIEPSFTRKVL